MHAKSNNMGVLFELCQLFIKSLPESSIESFEDIYSFQYRNGRDLSGFIDGKYLWHFLFLMYNLINIGILNIKILFFCKIL